MSQQLPHSTDLSAARRAADLAALRDGEPLDLLVVGGGITGVGVALDAASRGLRVALVERRDLAWGTSRWSSKLVHGGVRYLAQGAVGVAMESARERRVLLERTAPHLVRPLRQLIALTPQISPASERKFHAGLRIADGLRVAAGSSGHDLQRVHRVDAATFRGLAPGVRAAGLRGGLVAWDAQLEDDARLVVAIARTAAGHGARIVTRCGVVAASGDGATLRDELTGEQFDVHARAVVAATGVWASELAPDLQLRPSRGTHLVVSRDRLGGLAGNLSVPVPGESSRFVFAVPQRSGLAYIGLTDEEAPGPPADVPQPSENEIEFLLAVMSSVLERPLERADVLGTYAGLRPLLDRGEGARTADLSRRHAVHTGADGMISIVGGKLTTYRKMAEDAVDAAVAHAGLTAGPCRTRDLPLVGAAPAGALEAVIAPRRLVERHGIEAPRVLALAQGDPELLAPVAPGLDVLGVEVLHALRSEGALDLDDLLDRRTRIGLVPADRERAASAVAALAGREAVAA